MSEKKFTALFDIEDCPTSWDFCERLPIDSIMTQAHSPKKAASGLMTVTFYTQVSESELAKAFQIEFPGKKLNSIN